MHLAPVPTSAKRALSVCVLSLGLSVCLCVSACIPPEPQTAPPTEPALPVFKSTGREPLGDLAVKLGMLVRKGFVLGVPSLHDLPVSLYIPQNASASQAIEIFRAALSAHNLVLSEHADYWLISPLPPAPAPTPAPEDSPFRQTNAGLLIDLDQVRLVEVTRTLSQLAGLRFAIAPELAEHRITIQALKPVSAAEALDLLIATLTIEGIFVYRKGDLISISASPVAASASPYLDDGPVIPPRTARTNKPNTSNPPRPLPDTVP